MSGMPPRSTVSLVLTVLNEAPTIAGVLESISEQSVLPDQVVVIDGGSTDETFSIVSSWSQRTRNYSIIIEQSPGANIATGRNEGIARASGEIIAITDAGTVPDREWLERLTTPLCIDPSLDVASGFFRPGGKRLSLLIAQVTLPLTEELDARTFLPSSRSIAFRRSSWLKVGGYPEHLDYCEDLVFDLRLREANMKFTLVSDAQVVWDGRPTLRAFWRQYFRYAAGDGKAGLWPVRHALRYLTYSAVMIGPCFYGRRVNSLLCLAYLGVYQIKYFRRCYKRSAEFTVPARAARLAFTPVIVIVGDLAKMCGYPIGLAERRSLAGRELRT